MDWQEASPRTMTTSQEEDVDLGPAAATCHQAPPVCQNLGLDTLIGRAGISLDGRSLNIPDSMSDYPDEISSINSSIYPSERYKRTASGGGGGAILDIRPSETTEPLESESHKEEEGGAKSSTVSPATHSRESLSVPEPTGEDPSSPKSTFVPGWVARAPLWLKLLVALSTLLMLSAIVLVAVGFSLALDDDEETSSGDKSRFDSPTFTFPPRPAPPSGGETLAPVVAPAVAVTQAPVPAPTLRPTAQPTTMAPTMPINLDEIKFYVTAGRYQGSDLEQAAKRLSKLPKRAGRSFLVHMGDFNSPEQTSCVESSYQEAVDLFGQSSVPVYFVVGDNEYNDCRNPEEALGFWKKYVGDFHDNFWQRPEDVVALDGYGEAEETFSFYYEETAFVSLNVVAGTVFSESEFRDRLDANLFYVSDLYWELRKSVSTIFLFAHAEVPGAGVNANFYESLFQSIEEEYTDVHFVLVCRGGVTSRYGIEKRYQGIKNLDVITVVGPVWPPLEITLNTREKNARNAVSISLDEWYQGS